MKRKHSKLVIIALFIGVIACVMAYGDKGDTVTLPDAVIAAINKLYPQSAIEEVETEKEGIKVYEIELKQNNVESEITATPDGTIIETESEVTLADLPDAVKTAIAEASGGAEAKEINQEVTYAIVKLVELDQPKITYEIEVVIDGQEVEIELAADGTMLSKKVEDDDEDDEDHGDEDEDEVLVSIDDVPEAVKAIILTEAGTGTIKEIEMETEDGQTIYEADVTVDGQEIEIKVAPDGTLLGKETDDDDEDD